MRSTKVRPLKVVSNVEIKLSEPQTCLKVVLSSKMAANNQRRHYKDRFSYTNNLDLDMMERFRLPRDSLERLIGFLEEDLAPATRRSRALTAEQKITTALRFYATGSFQTVLGDAHGMGKASVSRTITQVTNSILRCPQLPIRMPANHDSTMLGFFNNSRFSEGFGLCRRYAHCHQSTYYR